MSETPLIIDPPKAAPSQKAAVIAQRAPFLAWLARQVVLPLTPFLVGSLIRYMRSGSVTHSIFDASELSFSLAMFCLIGVFTARRLSDPEYREAAFTLFVIGVAVFMSLFSFAVLEDTRLNLLRESALDNATKVLSVASPDRPLDVVNQLMREDERNECDNSHRVVLSALAVLGLVFVAAGFVMRENYGFGEDV